MGRGTNVRWTALDPLVTHDCVACALLTPAAMLKSVTLTTITYSTEAQVAWSADRALRVVMKAPQPLQVGQGVLVDGIWGHRITARDSRPSESGEVLVATLTQRQRRPSQSVLSSHQ